VASSVNQPLYTIEILRLAASIPHLGKLDEPHGRAVERSPTCGSTVSVDVRIDEEGRVAALGQEVEACAFGQASAALMGAKATGKSLEEVEEALAEFGAWLEGSRPDPGGWPGLDALSPVRSRRGRHGAMLLPLKALLAAMRDAGATEAR